MSGWSEAEALQRGAALLYREARLLDERRWDEWLELYLPDAVFWMPAWDDESTLTSDPDSQLSLIYYDSRAGLEDRVWRIRSGKSVASLPLPRTTHLVCGVELVAHDAQGLHLCAAWTTQVYRTKRRETVQFHGRSEYALARSGDALRIARKKVTLMNDTVPTMLDVYCI